MWRRVGVVQCLSHTTFIVRDLDRMERVLTQVLGARKVYDSGNATFSLFKERFFLIGDDADYEAASPAPKPWVSTSRLQGEGLHAHAPRSHVRHILS
jgi:catechol 2,3-dioxygenase-like lactoylglutathione lyase family enzyme